VSSREDTGRYRGRRRAPSPPRARYAAVVTTAFVGAGVVALGSAALTPDLKADGPDLTSATMSSAVFAASDSDRQATVDRASRSDARTTATTQDQVNPDLWLLPMKNYTVTPPFGDSGDLDGLDLAAPEGTPYFAAHSGTVRLARYDGAYGLCVVIDAGNGISIVYAHSAQLLVHEGQRVEAGDAIGLVGSTGYSFSSHLHFEVQQHGAAINPEPFLLAHGVDVANNTSAVAG
jgi:murein DD-endopeptidase MepM/ murein hydrolase activator NlpD